MINMFSYSNFLYRRPRRREELDTSLGGGIVYNQVPHQIDVVRYLGGGMVRSVRSVTSRLDPAIPTEGGHLTFLEFESGAAASIVFSGYDYFDSDEFHFWVGELGEERHGMVHGSSRANLDATRAGRQKQKPSEEATSERTRWHHPHCGVAIISCALGDMRPSADGLLIYDRNGRSEVEILLDGAVPDKSGVIDEMLDAIWCDIAPVHNGRWGRATMEICEAILESSRIRKEIFLKHQVSSDN